MKVVCISDTHEKHEGLEVPDGDILIFAGDCSMVGSSEALHRFNEWLGKLPHEHKFWTYGNHEWTCDPNNRNYCSGYEKIITNGKQLNGNGAEVDGFKLWGSPMAPRFHGWAFGLEAYETFRYWRHIPENTDVLITHGPPRGIMDQNGIGEHCGCPNLTERVQQITTRVHVFGHIHTQYGVEERDGTRYVNASVLDDRYELVREAIVLEVD